MHKNKAVIFDLDGVLVDTAQYHYLAWRKMAQDLGFDISREQNEQLKGVSREHSLAKILQWGGIQVDQQRFQELMVQKNEDYLTSIEHLSQEDLLPGVRKVLDYLSQHNIPFALGSASRNAKGILRSMGIISRFAAVVDGTQVNKAKPDPEVFLLAASRMEVDPADCVVFEDAAAGIEAAGRAGMLSIGIGDKAVLSQADFVFPDFTAIDIAFIKRILIKH